MLPAALGVLVIVGVLLVELSAGAGYCSTTGWAQVHVVIIQENATLYAFGEVEGKFFSCSHVAYSVDLTTGNVHIPAFSRPTTCVGGLLSYYHINPRDISIFYDSLTDSVNITADGYSFSLIACAVDASKDPLTVTDLVLVEEIIVREVVVGDTVFRQTVVSTTEMMGKLPEVSNPTGAYCGQLDGLADINVTVLDSSFINASATIFGTNYNCSKEAYKLNVDYTITLPDILQPSDCIGTIISDFGQDPGSLLVSWNPNTDVITIQIAGQVISLSKTCPPVFEFSKEKALAKQEQQEEEENGDVFDYDLFI